MHLQKVIHELKVFVVGRESDGPALQFLTESPLPVPQVGERFDFDMWPFLEIEIRGQEYDEYGVGRESVEICEEGGCLVQRRTLWLTPFGAPIPDPEVVEAQRETAVAEKQAEIYKQSAHALAKSAASYLFDRCVQSIVTNMKALPSESLNGEGGCSTIFDESGLVLKTDGHILREMVTSDLEDRVDKTLHNLSANERLALWFAYDSSADESVINFICGDWSMSSIQSFDPLTSGHDFHGDLATRLVDAVKDELIARGRTLLHERELAAETASDDEDD